MNRVRELGRLAVALLIAGGFIAVIVLMADGLGAWDVLKAQSQARAAEARARELEAQAVILRERQAMIQTGVIAFASAKDSLLVTVTYLVGGLALAICVVVVCFLLWERGKDHERVL